MSATAPAPILPLFLGAIWEAVSHHPVGVRAGTEVFGPHDVVTEPASRTRRGICHIVEHEDNEMMRP
jgi:hypothetical protein